jgi:4-hydroxy-2-oxoheptanedioate aldolase
MAIPTFNLARALGAGETVFSGWCSLPYPIVAEMIGREGFAAVTLEAQHGLWDVSGLLTGVAAVRQSGAAPMVRVPVGDFALGRGRSISAPKASSRR